MFLLVVWIEFTIISALLFLFLFAVDIFFEKRKQIKKWNKGECSKCNGKWNLIRKNSFERIYICDKDYRHKCIITLDNVDDSK